MNHDIRRAEIHFTFLGDPPSHACFEGSPFSVLALLPRIGEHLLADKKRFHVADVVWDLDTAGAVLISVVADEEMPTPVATLDPEGEKH